MHGNSNVKLYDCIYKESGWKKTSKWVDLKLHATVLFLDKAAENIAVIWFTLFLHEHVQKTSLKWVATKKIPAAGQLFSLRNLWTPVSSHASDIDVKLKLKILWRNWLLTFSSR